MDIIYFSHQLKKERKKNNLTLTELADKSGVAKSSISYYENAEREPKLKTIDRLAKVLNVSSEELLYGKTRKTVKVSNEKLAEIIHMKLTTQGDQEGYVVLKETDGIEFGEEELKNE